MLTPEEYQAHVDQEAAEGKCFYCHLQVYDWDVEALHLANARGIKQHIHRECDRNLLGELAFEAYQESKYGG